MSIIKSSLKLSSLQGIGSVFNFLALAFFARELGPHVLGIYFLFQAVKSIIKLVSNMGLRSAMEKRISERQAPSDVFATGIVLRGLLMFPFLLGVSLFHSQINNYIGMNIIPLLIISIIVDEAGELLVFVLKGELRVGETAELQVTQQFAWVIFSVILVLAGWDVLALVYGSIAGSLLKLIWGFYKVTVPLGTVSLTQMKDLLSLGKYYLLPNIEFYLYNWLDILIIGFFLSQTAVGAYEIAWRIGAITIMFSKALANSLFPQISSWDTSMNRERIESVVPKALTVSYLLVIPSFFGILVLSKEILGIIFGSEYIFVSSVLVVLAIGKIFEAMRCVVGPTLRGIGKANLSTRAAAISGITNTFLNIILVWQFKLLGAALATMTAILFASLLEYRFLKQSIQFEFPIKEFVWLVISAIMMTIIVIPLQYQYPISSSFRLALVVGTGIIVYATVLLIYSPLREGIFNNIYNIISA